MSMVRTISLKSRGVRRTRVLINLAAVIMRRVLKILGVHLGVSYFLNLPHHRAIPPVRNRNMCIVSYVFLLFILPARSVPGKDRKRYNSRKDRAPQLHSRF